jgi:hypothetical protein
MDGLDLSPPRSAPRRLLLAALALLVVAGGPGIALADDARAASPAARWPATGTAVQTATSLAAERWGFSPCGGRVNVTWAALSAGLNAEASWTNELDPYLQPSRNGDCAVVLSTGQDWDWPKLCSVVIHELGHLAGHDHVDDPEDVMYFTYVQPIPECLATPEPVQAAVTAPAATPAPRRATQATSDVKAKARAKARKRAAKPARWPATGHRAKHPGHRR